MIVLKPQEMQILDKKTIEAGFPELLLMETAGRGIADLAVNIVEQNARVLILVGKGNNGGDGLVAARFLAMWGLQVTIISMAKQVELNSSSLINFKICKLKKIEIKNFEDLKEKDLNKYILHAGLIIDALLGTGIKGEVREPFAGLIRIVNKNKNNKTKVIAVDIPSGIDGAKGKVCAQAIKADYTITMQYPKLGLCVYPACAYVGKLKVVDLGMPDKIIKEINNQHFMLQDKEAASLLPERLSTAHKGTFGKVLVVGGRKGMAGAPSLTAMAALKIGAGIVKVAVPASIQDIVASFSPEIITENFSNHTFFQDSIADNNLDVLALGPGLGKGKDLTTMVEKLLLEMEVPIVLDADGINALTELELLKKRKYPLIMTPHPGEMARLLNTDIKTVEKQRLEIARDFAQEYGVYLILKGARTIIALPDGKLYINPTGNEGMATAGSGDVLTGMIAGLLAQGLEVTKAVILAPYLHGLAGDLAKEELTSYSLKAGDIITYIPKTIKELIVKL